MTLDVFLKLDAATLRRRLANEEFLLTAMQRRADLINEILDMIDSGEIEQYCKERSESIKTCIKRIDQIKLCLMAKEME